MSDFLYTNLTNMNHLNNWLKIMLGKEINYSRALIMKNGTALAI
jgi:hypothetical protein